ncbi:MAG: nickel pincer cofactor biosynthesis protein LarC [Cyanophyceae cyanobacterium]
MKVAYLDCAAGIAGDMCLGALIDCGVPADYLAHKLEGMGLAGEFQLYAHRVMRAGQPAMHAVVDLISTDHPHHRHWPQIHQMIETASLSPKVKAWSQAVFRTLAEAEAVVHEMPIEKVHFHEVGAVDALVDVVGTCIGLEWLQVERIVCSPHPIGGGWVHAAHGQMAVPVPAVIQLWEQGQVPVFSNGIEAELVTPTGAALAVALADSFGDLPPMRVQKVGKGAGTRNLAIPNVVRLWLGDSAGSSLTETVAVLETQIDDLNPQVIGYVFEQLLKLGALDVFGQPITMKFSRPGHLLTVICPPDLLEACEGLLFRETTTLGIRRSLQQRTLLDRAMERVSTLYGEVNVKVGRRFGQVINVQPEFRDCAALAQQAQVPVQEVWLAAHQAWSHPR